MLALAMEFSRIARDTITIGLPAPAPMVPMEEVLAAEGTCTLPQSCTGCPSHDGILQPGHFP
jgi:hypothetical protein